MSPRKSAKVTSLASASPKRTLTDFQLQLIESAALEVAEKSIASDRYAVLAAEFLQEAGQWILRITVEGRGFRVSLEECARLSRQMNEDLGSLAELSERRYFLEVSSPGLFRPLKTARELAFYCGSRVCFTDEEERPVSVEGLPFQQAILKAYEASGQTLTLQEGEQTAHVSLGQLPQGVCIRLAPEVTWPNDDVEEKDMEEADNG